MSSVRRDMVEGYESIARSIQAFTWEGKPYKSRKIEHTKEELEAKLEEITKRCWDRYDEGARELGWR